MGRHFFCLWLYILNRSGTNVFGLILNYHCRSFVLGVTLNYLWRVIRFVANYILRLKVFLLRGFKVKYFARLFTLGLILRCHWTVFELNPTLNYRWCVFSRILTLNFTWGLFVICLALTWSLRIFSHWISLDVYLYLVSH